MLKCIQKTQGGKGNENRFTERGPRGILAAGIPTAQPDDHTSEHLKDYQLQDEIDALIGDAIISKPEPEPSPTLPKHRDMRHAGFYTEVHNLINPPTKTKFEELVDDLRATALSSYWKKPVGKTPDPVPFLPAGFNVLTDTLGRKNIPSESAYDVIMPKNTPITKTSPSKDPGYQTNRNYCESFDPSKIFGVVCKPDTSGRNAKCCFSEDRVMLGKGNYTPRSALEANLKESRDAQLGTPRQPNHNIDCVPPGFAFGEILESDTVPICLTKCKINIGRYFFMKCLGHLNTLKKCLSKRFDGLFFKRFYLNLKYLDKDKTGWLPKEVVYDYCSTQHVRVIPNLIEPLLEMWNGFDGSRIKYQLFVNVINFKNHLPDLPRITDMEDSCLEFSTTYRDMVMPGQAIDTRHKAGLPTGRYFDSDYVATPPRCCKAIRVCLPEESDATSCVFPTVFTHFGVNHRDMYAKRSPETVRKVFEAIGEKFTDESFNECWEEAKKYHSQGWVSFETFKRVLYNK